MSMSVVAVLKGARAIIAQQRAQEIGRWRNRDTGDYCAAGAIGAAAGHPYPNGTVLNEDEQCLSAVKLLGRAVAETGDEWNTLLSFNDTRSKAEVLAAFDEAISRAGSA